MTILQYVKYKLKEKRAIKECPFNEPLHYHHDGCPSCNTYWESLAINNPDDGSWVNR